MSWLRPLALFCFVFGFVLTGAPSGDMSTAEAAPESQVEKKRRKKRRQLRKRQARRRRAARKKGRAARPRQVTAKRIRRWQAQGLTNVQIVARAQKAGYRVTPREQVRLRRARVRKSLRKALVQASVPAARATKKEGYLNAANHVDPNEIDFDSVPPPDGMPRELAEAHRRDARRSLTQAKATPARRPARVPIRKKPTP